MYNKENFKNENKKVCGGERMWVGAVDKIQGGKQDKGDWMKRGARDEPPKLDS